MSIERKLPLFIGTLLAVVIGALTVASWLELRQTVERSAAERLSGVTEQFRENFHRSATQLRELMAVDVTSRAIATYAGGERGAAARDAALAAMRHVTVQPAQVVATELRDGAGRVLLSSSPSESALAALPLADVLPAIEPSDGPVIGGFHVLRDTLVYPVAAPVPGTDDVYLVRWRTMTGSRRTRELLTELVGPGAVIYLGNTVGEGWSDLERPVARPGFLADSGPSAAQRSRNGGRLLVATAPVPESPWTVAIGLPRAAVFAPVNDFLRRVGAIAALALTASLLAAWALSRRITRPITRLTNAAEGMAAGRYDQPVPLDSDDELGRLASAFSLMSAEVRRSRDTLEEQVRERTRELRDAQDSLVRGERLALLGQLSASVGHELRNPLGVMSNAVYYLKAVLRDPPAKVHEYLDIIQQQVNLSERIVNDLLDFARQKPPQQKPTPLRELTERQVERLGRCDGVRIELDIPDEVPDALVDPVQAGQIIFNLLANAVQALDGSGRVDVAARATDGDARIQYVVSDSGPGVPAGNAERIFEPLFTSKARGIGLGLAVSRMFARNNGGDLVLRTNVGRGATFVLTLASAPKAAMAMEVR